MENIVKIEAQVKKLTDDLTQCQDHLNKNVLPEIKKLREQKKSILSHIATIDGAIQAYKASAQLFRETEVKNDVEMKSEEVLS